MIVHGLLSRSLVRIRKTNPALFTLRAQAIVQKFYNPRCCYNSTWRNVKHDVDLLHQIQGVEAEIRGEDSTPVFIECLIVLRFCCVSFSLAEDFTAADIPLVDRTPTFSRDERMLATLAGGLGIGVLLMMFAAVDAALSTWG